MPRALRVVGLVWCYAVAALILLSVGWVFWQQGLFGGFTTVSDWFSPFNLANFIVTGLALAPGLACLWAAEKLAR